MATHPHTPRMPNRWHKYNHLLSHNGYGEVLQISPT